MMFDPNKPIYMEGRNSTFTLLHANVPKTPKYKILIMCNETGGLYSCDYTGKCSGGGQFYNKEYVYVWECDDMMLHANQELHDHITSNLTAEGKWVSWTYSCKKEI